MSSGSNYDHHNRRNHYYESGTHPQPRPQPQSQYSPAYDVNGNPVASPPRAVPATYNSVNVNSYGYPTSASAPLQDPRYQQQQPRPQQQQQLYIQKAAYAQQPQVQQQQKKASASAAVDTNDINKFLSRCGSNARPNPEYWTGLSQAYPRPQEEQQQQPPVRLLTHEQPQGFVDASGQFTTPRAVAMEREDTYRAHRGDGSGGKSQRKKRQHGKK